MKKTKKWITFLGDYTKGFRGMIIFSLVFIILRTVVSFLIPQIIRVTVDSVMNDLAFPLPDWMIMVINQLGGRIFLKENLYLIGILLLLLALLICIFDYFSKTKLNKATESMIKKIREDLYFHIQRLPFQWHTKNQTGELVQKCTSDVDVIRMFLSNQVLEFFKIICLIGIALVFMYSINPTLTYLSAAFVPVVLLYTSIFYGVLSKKFLIADEAEGVLFSVAQENLTGVRVVRAFGREEYEIGKFLKKNKHFSDMWIHLGYKMGYYWGVGDFFSGLQVMVIVIFGSIETINGAMYLGDFLAFVSYNAMLVWPIRAFGRVLADMSKVSVSAQRILEIFEIEEEKNSRKALKPNMKQDISFTNIGFSYEKGVEVLKNISFTIKTGSTFAILGSTGSGKTTLMHLLNRLYEVEEGSICIGDTDIKDIDLEYLRTQIGMVLQEPFLFSKTIKENIGIAKPDLDIKHIRESAKVACVDDSIVGFAKGYDTIVGERGVTLSGGQKQRVAIARTLLQNTPIVVLDDSLSAVDSDTDRKIRTALKERAGKATMILISHRITTLMQADQIMVLEKGRLQAIGTHEELIKKEGIYKDIYEIQMAPLLKEGNIWKK